MKIEYEGQSYTYDMADVTLKQAMAIEKHTGLPFREWGKIVAAGGNLVAMQAVGWLLLAGGDLKTPIEDVDFKLIKLGEAFANADTGEDKAPPPDAPRPTVPVSSAPPSPDQNGAADLSPLSLTADS